MENEDLPRVADVEFDERKETWYVDLRGQSRVELTRPALGNLVHLYNRIHRGDPLHLLDESRLHQIHHYNQRLSRTVRDLYLVIDKDREKRILRRLIGWLPRLLRRLRPRRPS
jgi:hypothetical protein